MSMSNDPKDNPVDANATILNQGEGELGFQRSGPIISAEDLRDEYFFGIPLTAPLTGQELSDKVLDKVIRKAVGDFETSVRVPVSPVRAVDKFDYDRGTDLQFSTRQLSRWPLLKVEKLVAVFPGQSEAAGYDYPTGWVTPQSDSGLIRVVPTNDTILDNDGNPYATLGSRALYMGRINAYPNVWRITYTAGFDFDKIPDIVNDLIGTYAAIRILSMVGPAIFPINSFSSGIDGMSQSTGNGGPQWLSERVQELTADRDRLVMQLKNHYGTNITFTVF